VLLYKDLNEEGAQSLADKVKILQQTYGNDSTDIERIALVGCSTDGVNQNLTQDFAKAIYNDIPELTTAEITGRKGDIDKTKAHIAFRCIKSIC
jgi:hypothetical protein